MNAKIPYSLQRTTKTSISYMKLTTGDIKKECFSLNRKMFDRDTYNR